MRGWDDIFAQVGNLQMSQEGEREKDGNAKNMSACVPENFISSVVLSYLQ